MYGFANCSRYSATSSSRRTPRIDRLLQLLPKDDVHRSLGAHDGDLRSRPGEVEVGSDVLRAHDVVRPSVGLAGDHRELRHRRLAVRIEELRTVTNDPAPFLRRPRQEAGHVDEGDERHVESVT